MTLPEHKDSRLSILCMRLDSFQAELHCLNQVCHHGSFAIYVVSRDK